jgi:DNA-binding GntR family transcriptional regulator
LKKLCNDSIADKLLIPQNQMIVCVKRIRLVNNEPIAYQISYMDSNLLSLNQAQRIRENKSFL